MLSKADIKTAKLVNLVDFCEYMNLDLKCVSHQKGDYKVNGNGGLIINENMFYWFGEEKGGDIITFCQAYFKWSFPKAVRELRKFSDSHKVPSTQNRLCVPSGAQRAGLKKKKRFVLPEKNTDNKRVFTYLTKSRGISPELVNRMISSNFVYQDKHNNCVFPCYDESGVPKGALIRGTLTDLPFKKKASGTDVSYGWILEPEKPTWEVIITESPIDAMSFLELYPEAKKHYFLSLNGLHESAIDTFLKQYPMNRIFIALDNDEAGEETTKNIIKNYEALYCTHVVFLERGKDWNEQLMLSKH